VKKVSRLQLARCASKSCTFHCSRACVGASSTDTRCLLAQRTSKRERGSMTEASRQHSWMVRRRCATLCSCAWRATTMAASSTASSTASSRRAATPPARAPAASPSTAAPSRTSSTRACASATGAAHRLRRAFRALGSLFADAAPYAGLVLHPPRSAGPDDESFPKLRLSGTPPCAAVVPLYSTVCLQCRMIRKVAVRDSGGACPLCRANTPGGACTAACVESGGAAVCVLCRLVLIAATAVRARSRAGAPPCPEWRREPAAGAAGESRHSRTRSRPRQRSARP